MQDKQIKLIVCDLDGTLLNSEKRITSLTQDRIAQSYAKGVPVTICSGRIFTMLEAYVKELNIKVPLISSNGAVVSSPDGRILSGVRLEMDDFYPAFAYCLNKRLDYILVCDEACYYRKNSLRVKRFEQYNELAAAQDLDEIPLIELPLPEEQIDEAYARHTYPEFNEMAVRKILIYDLNLETHPEIIEAIRSRTKLQVSTSDPGLLEVMAPGVDKGSGLALLAKQMNLSADEIMVCGDFDNDLPMFKWAGFKVAMANAVDEIKELATYITGSNDEDGVGQAIEKFILNNSMSE